MGEENFLTQAAPRGREERQLINSFFPSDLHFATTLERKEAAGFGFLTSKESEPTASN